TLGSIEPEAKPGERVIYSDLNFLLFGDLLELHFSAPLDTAFAKLVGQPAGSVAAFLPGRSARVAATEKGDVTERRMTAEMGLSYPRFRDGVVWGEVHDGNGHRRRPYRVHGNVPVDRFGGRPDRRPADEPHPSAGASDRLQRRPKTLPRGGLELTNPTSSAWYR